METCESNCKLGQEYLCAAVRWSHCRVGFFHLVSKAMKIQIWYVFLSYRSCGCTSLCWFSHDRIPFRSVNVSYAIISSWWKSPFLPCLVLSNARKSKQSVAFNSNINMYSPPVVSLHTRWELITLPVSTGRFLFIIQLSAVELHFDWKVKVFTLLHGLISHSKCWKHSNRLWTVSENKNPCCGGKLHACSLLSLDGVHKSSIPIGTSCPEDRAVYDGDSETESISQTGGRFRPLPWAFGLMLCMICLATVILLIIFHFMWSFEG